MAIQTMEKISYVYTFPERQLKPLIETRVIYGKEDFFALFSKSLLAETLMKKGSAEIIAEAKEQKPQKEGTKKVFKTGKEEVESKTYILTYFNPELNKAEVLTTDSEIKIKDPIEENIEEALGAKSALGIYTFVATPLIKKEVNQYILEEILKNIEYDTPPPFGAGQMIIKAKEETKSVPTSVIVKEEQTNIVVPASDIKETQVRLSPITFREKPEKERKNQKQEKMSNIVRVDIKEEAKTVPLPSRAKKDIMISIVTSGIKEELKSAPVHIRTKKEQMKRIVIPDTKEDQISTLVPINKKDFKEGQRKSKKEPPIIIPLQETEKVKDAIVETIQRKEKMEDKLGQEIIVLEDAIISIKNKKAIDLIIEKLPPLTRARFQVLLKRKKLNSEIIAILLKKDVKFLKEVKKKLEGMGAKDLLGFISIVKKLIKK